MVALRVFSWVLSRPGKSKVALSGKRQACRGAGGPGPSARCPVMGNTAVGHQQPSALSRLPATLPSPRDERRSCAWGWLATSLDGKGREKWLPVSPGHPLPLVTAWPQLRRTWVVATSPKVLPRTGTLSWLPKGPSKGEPSWRCRCGRGGAGCQPGPEGPLCCCLPRQAGPWQPHGLSLAGSPRRFWPQECGEGALPFLALEVRERAILRPRSLAP